LTTDNWLEPDPTLEAFARFDLRRGVSEALSVQHVAEGFLSVSLPESGPEEIRRLFEAAGSAALYGSFFYPLLAPADDQLHRVADAAVQVHYQLLGGAKELSLFARLNWLHQGVELTDDELERWPAIGHVRNNGSHPSVRALVTPSDVRATTLALMADFIGALFPESPTLL
jgi:hypothetical protein